MTDGSSSRPLHALACFLEIVVRLETHPKLLRRAKVLRKPNRGVGRDATLAEHDLIDATWRHANRPRDRILAESHRLEELLEEHLARLLRQLRRVAVLCEELLATGALDVWSTAITMKKGRPAVTISALAGDDKFASVRDAFFKHSTTLGVRMHKAERHVLARSMAQVTTPWGGVAVKLSALGGEILGAAPEFEDCRKLAAKAGVATRTVHAAATAAALKLLRLGRSSR